MFLQKIYFPSHGALDSQEFCQETMPLGSIPFCFYRLVPDHQWYVIGGPWPSVICHWESLSCILTDYLQYAEIGKAGFQDGFHLMGASTLSHCTAVGAFRGLLMSHPPKSVVPVTKHSHVTLCCWYCMGYSVCCQYCGLCCYFPSLQLALAPAAF